MSLIVSIILMVTFSVVGILVGFFFTYYMICNKGKKQVKQQVIFGYEQAKSMYLMYKGKNPTEQQINSMIAAYKNNK